MATMRTPCLGNQPEHVQPEIPVSDSSLKAPIFSPPWHSHGHDVCLRAVGGARDALQRAACHVTAPAVAALELAPCSLQARQH